jgi:polysaccharide biosynthesis transport protein
MNTETRPNFISYWFILKRRWVPATLVFISTLGMTIAYVVLVTPVFRIQGQMIYEQDKSSSLIGFASSSKDQSVTGADEERKLVSELQVILSQPVLQRTLDLLKSGTPPSLLPNLEKFREDLIVKNVSNTNIIQISYDSEDSKLAALIVNKLMQVYQQNNVQVTRSASISARKFITAQLPEVRQNVYRADIALRQFKKLNKLTSLDVATKSNAENLARIGGQIDQAKVQLTSLDSDYRNLQKKLGINSQEGLEVSSVSQSLAVQSSLADVQSLEQKLEGARAQYQSDHPLVIELAAKVDKAKMLLKTKVTESLKEKGTPEPSRLQVGATQQELINTLIKTDINRTGLENQVSTLNRQRLEYMTQAQVLPILEQRQRELERELAAAEATYQSLLKSLQEVSVSENQTIGNVRIIEPAQIPLLPIVPKQGAALAVGTLVGVLLAIALIYLLDAMDTRMKEIDEFKELFDYPVLGTIPTFSELKKNGSSPYLEVLKDPGSPLVESYSMLQANLKFLRSDSPLRLVTITSSMPQEGKSTNCANLAATLNHLGHNVLIVDLDLRRPTQHQIWQVNNVLGISDFLAGQVDDIIDVTKTIKIGLELITSGTIPPNPLGLINSNRMIEAIKNWSDNYDFVLIDTPPMSIAADAAVIGKLTDGVILIARPNVLEKASAHFTKNFLDQSGLNILGLVINGVIAENEYTKYNMNNHYNNYYQTINKD